MCFNQLKAFVGFANLARLITQLKDYGINGYLDSLIGKFLLDIYHFYPIL